MSRECRSGQTNAVQHDEEEPLPTTKATINGKLVTCLLDTGLTLPAMVDPELVNQDDYTGETVFVRYADGRSKPLPLAQVQIESEFVTDTISAAVQKHLPYKALLGCRYILPRLSLPVQVEEEVNVVQTRAAKKAVAPLDAPVIVPNTQPGEIRRLQQTDDTLTAIRKRMEAGTSEKEWKGAATYLKRDGMILREYERRGEVISQLVVPKEKREAVLKIGHESLSGGHLGTTKVLEKITREFYWPGINGDVRRYVRSCDTCQRLGPKNVRPAPLTSMPIIDQPFRRVGVDLVGPIVPSSNQGNGYIVTAIDYARHYLMRCQ